MMILKYRSVFLSFLLLILALPTLNAETELKTNDFIANLISQQVEKNIALDKSIRALLVRFPEQVESVLYTAFSLYPDRYTEIINGAITAEPVLSCNVIHVALQAKIASLEEILGIVIAAEPAYAQEVIHTALEHHPLKIEKIVSVAITTDPAVASSIVPGTMKAYPEQYSQVLAVSIQSIPDKTMSFTDIALATFPKSTEQTFSVAFSASENKYHQALIAKAIDYGFTKTQAQALLQKHIVK